MAALVSYFGLVVGISFGFLLPMFWRRGKCCLGHCDNRKDPRCATGCCVFHCNTATGCNGACLKAWSNSEAANRLATRAIQEARLADEANDSHPGS